MKAMPRYVRPPIVGLDVFRFSLRQISLRRYGEYEGCSFSSQRPRALWGCRRLRPGTGVEALQVLAEAAPAQWHREFRQGASYHEHWRRQLQYQRISLPVGEDTDFGSSLTAISGILADFVSAKPGFPHADVSGLPFPADSREFVAVACQHRPNSGHDSILAPTLEPAMNSAVTPEFLWQPVPLCTGAHAIDDSVEDLAKTRSGTAPFLTPGIGLEQNAGND